MNHYLLFLLTLGAGTVFGIVFMLIKFPNGLRIGALLGAALLGIFFGAAWMPPQTKYVVQVIAGSIVGCMMERSDLKRLPMVIKPMAITLGAFLVLNLGVGSLVYAISSMDLVTALLCVVPGGIAEIPIIAADMGADTPSVAVVQLARYFMGVVLFPPMILAYDNLREKSGSKSQAVFSGEVATGVHKREKSNINSIPALLCTLAVGFGMGFLGNLTGIPAGTFLFSAVGIMILKLKFDFAYIPGKLKNVILVISGCFIGSLIGMEDVLGFRLLALPILIILGSYIINCFITGKIISKTCGFTRKEGMLTTTPAGASDIALSSADIGVQNTDVIIIQIFRAIVAAAVFPQIINLLLLVLPG